MTIERFFSSPIAHSSEGDFVAVFKSGHVVLGRSVVTVAVVVVVVAAITVTIVRLSITVWDALPQGTGPFAVHLLLKKKENCENFVFVVGVFFGSQKKLGKKLFSYRNISGVPV